MKGFLAELSPDKNTLWAWIEKTKREEKGKYKFLGGNAATLLCYLDKGALSGKDLSNADISNANLAEANLDDVNLTDTLMRNVNLVDAMFSDNQMKDAILENGLISVAFLGYAKNLENEKQRDKLHVSFLNLFLKERGVTFLMSPAPYFYENQILLKPVFRVYDYQSIQTIYQVAQDTPYIKAIYIFREEIEKLNKTLSRTLKRSLAELFSSTAYY